MKWGILLTAFNCADTLEQCLTPWIELKDELGLVISAVSVPFAEYKDMAVPVDNTRDILEGYLARREIDFLFTEPDYLGEAAARSLALNPLLSIDVETVQLLDGDEVMEPKQIRAAYKFVEKSEDVCWFSNHFRNYIGDGKGYVEGFCPPRFFRTKCGNLSLNRFVWDNDPVYRREDGVEFDYRNLPASVMPKNLYYPRHYTWMQNERSRLKIIYQTKHFGHCSYKWEDGEIKFNPDYYKKIGKPIPELIYE